jgi:hypothetical protein
VGVPKLGLLMSSKHNKNQFNLGGGDLVVVNGKVVLLPIPLGLDKVMSKHSLDTHIFLK